MRHVEGRATTDGYDIREAPQNETMIETIELNCFLFTGEWNHSVGFLKVRNGFRRSTWAAVWISQPAARRAAAVSAVLQVSSSNLKLLESVFFLVCVCVCFWRRGPFFAYSLK